MWAIFFPMVAYGYTISQIPESGPAPSPRVLGSSAYDSILNRIIFLGGEGLEGSYDLSSNLYEFSLNSFKWKKIASKLGNVPPGLKDIRIYIRQSDSKLFVFGGMTTKGLNTVLYSFDLKRLFWDNEIMTGDVMSFTTKFSYVHFTYKNVNYIAIYGGYNAEGPKDDFYLIEAENMFVKIMPKTGDHPGIRQVDQIFYYNETIYMYGCDEIFRNLSMYKFDLETETWTYVNIFGDTPKNLVHHDIYIRDDSFYLIYGVNAEIKIASLFFYHFNFTTSYMTQLPSSLNVFEFSFFHTTVDVNGKVYRAFGKSITEYLNSITMIEFDKDKVTRTIISPQYISPEPRRNHLSFVSNQYMYIYGGINDDAVYLKDMWKFNFLEKRWTKVEYFGKPPLYREHMAHVQVYDIGLYAFGGQTGTEYFNDIYFYEQKNRVWVKYSEFENSPNPRYGSCIVHNSQKLYVIGGQNNQYAFSDIWSFDSLESTFSLLEDRLPFSLAFHKCWVVDRSDKFYIYIMGGKTFQGVTLKKVHRLSINKSSNTVFTEEILYESQLTLFYTSLVVSGSSAHLFMGSPFESTIFIYMITYDMCQNKISFTRFPHDYGVYGHSAIHYGKSIYVFGGGYSIKTQLVDNSASNNLYNFSLPEILNCSLGLYEQGSECFSCPSGTYGEYSSLCENDEFCQLCSITNNTCAQCGKGRYSDSIGSSSKHTCSLCLTGYYNNKPGSSRCRMCPQSEFCPIGCSEPLIYSKDYEYSFVQPDVYESKHDFVTNIVQLLWIVVATSLAIVLLSFILLKKISAKLNIIDIYSNAHPQKLEVPVMYRKTSIGGLFSIFFFFILIAILASGYITYIYDNIYESRTLVPLVTVKENPEAKDFTVIAQFHVYGGECTGLGEGNCNTELSIYDTDLNYDKRLIECKVVENSCIVQMSYKRIKTIGDFTIYYKMKEFLSYTNLMIVNVSISTGIPGGFSENYIPIYPKPENFIFRGTTPTVLTFEIIPTFFKSESSKWASFDKGFHLRYDQNPEYGKMIDPIELYTTSYVYLKLEFKISSTALNISRDLKTSLYLMISGIIGLLAGVLQVLGTVMSQFEKIKRDYLSKKLNRIKFKEVIQKRDNLEDFLYFKPETIKIKKSMTFLKPECNIRSQMMMTLEYSDR